MRSANPEIEELKDNRCFIIHALIPQRIFLNSIINAMLRTIIDAKY